MARKIRSRLKISGKLYAKTSLHFGCNETRAGLDMPLGVNGEGKLYVPGTNIAGWLRSWMEQLIDLGGINQKDIDNLWGLKTDNSVNNNDGFASFITVEDGVISGCPLTEIRDGVSIDRNWGVAVDKQKFDREIIPYGSKIDFKLSVERNDSTSDNDWEKQKYLFKVLLESIEKEELRFGACKTRGSGRVKLFNLKIKEQNLSTAKGILAILRDAGESRQLDNISSWQGTIKKSPQLRMKIHWEPLSPVMVKSDVEGIAVDILPLVSGVDGDLTLVIPGSSIKGVMRAQSEKIVRTVTSCPAREDFFTQIQLDLVNTLFGKAVEKDKEGFLGAFSPDDCYAKSPIKYSQWQDIVFASSSSDLIKALESSSIGKSQQAFHVAIDRWTGGAANHALYSVLEPMAISWNPIEIILDLNRLGRKNIQGKYDENYLPRVALLFLVIRDLMNRRIPFGYGTNRGMGDIKVNKIEFTGVGELAELESLKDFSITKGDFSEIDSSLLKNLTDKWQQWIDNSEVNQ